MNYKPAVLLAIVCSFCLGSHCPGQAQQSYEQTALDPQLRGLSGDVGSDSASAPSVPQSRQGLSGSKKRGTSSRTVKANASPSGQVKSSKSIAGATFGLVDRSAKASVGLTDRAAKTSIGLTDRAAKTSIGVTYKATKVSVGVPYKAVKGVLKAF